MYGQVVVNSGTAVQIIQANSQRLSLIITNNGASSVLLGQDANITTATGGVLLVANGTFSEDNGGTKMYCGPFYAIAIDNQTTIGYWETIR